MGVYDIVKYSCPCPVCGEKLDNFQSKSGPCAMIEVEVWEVDNFYGSCYNCGKWVKFKRKRPHPRPDWTPEEYVKEFF